MEPRTEDVEAVPAQIMAALAAGLPAGVTWIDEDFVIRFVNEASAGFTGVPAERLINRRLHDALPGFNAESEALYRTVRLSGKPLVLRAQPPTVRQERVIGTLWDATIAPYHDEAGRFRGWFVYTLEVTHQVRTERELVRQRDLTRRIVDNSPLAISLFDADFRYLYVNPTHLMLTRRREEDVVGYTVAEAFPKTWDQVGPVVKRVLETGEPYRAASVKIPMLRDGTWDDTYWDIHFIRLLDPTDGRRSLLSISQEVSDRVAAEAHKDQFLGILSHELRTPINAIMGFGSILEDGLAGELNAQQVDYVGRILGSTERMLALVDDLLDMSRIQAGKFLLMTQAVRLADVAGQVVAEQARAAAAREMAIALDLPADLPTAQADPPRLAQILTNLVGNAVRYAPRGATVTIRARAAGRVLRVEVHDPGEPIRAEVQAYIFQPFTQLDMSTTRPQGGLGLGLSIVKALVEAHGGTLGVTAAPAAGNTFWFTLPVMLDS